MRKKALFMGAALLVASCCQLYLLLRVSLSKALEAVVGHCLGLHPTDDDNEEEEKDDDDDDDDDDDAGDADGEDKAGGTFDGGFESSALGALVACVERACRRTATSAGALGVPKVGAGGVRAGEGTARRALVAREWRCLPVASCHSPLLTAVAVATAAPMGAVPTGTRARAAKSPRLTCLGVGQELSPLGCLGLGMQAVATLVTKV